MKEYKVEDSIDVDLSKLVSEPMSAENYTLTHRSTVILCHDIFIEYKSGILLIHRKNYPAKNILWPIGGRVERGLPIETSLMKKVKNECNLELSNIQILGFARTFFSTEPFGHRKGTDTFNIVYYANGTGELKLDDAHEKPSIIRRSQITNDMKTSLHPYVRDHLDKIFQRDSEFTTQRQ